MFKYLQTDSVTLRAMKQKFELNHWIIKYLFFLSSSSVVGAGVAVLAIPMAHSFYVLACSVGMYGLCLGCWFLLVPVLLADQYGTDKISSSYGLVRMFQSFGAISIPPLAGTSLSRPGNCMSQSFPKGSRCSLIWILANLSPFFSSSL